MSFSCGPHGWRHMLKGCPACEVMFQKTSADTRYIQAMHAPGKTTLAAQQQGWGHAGPCAANCTCDVARNRQGAVNYRPGNHIVGKVYDLTQANMNAMLDQIDLLTRTYQGLTASYEAARKEVDRLEAALKHEKKRRALLVKAIEFGSKRDSGRGDQE